MGVMTSIIVSSGFILTSQHLLTTMKTMAVSCIKTENKIGGPTETKKHKTNNVLLDFSLTVKAVPHKCVIRTSQP